LETKDLKSHKFELKKCIHKDCFRGRLGAQHLLKAKKNGNFKRTGPTAEDFGRWLQKTSSLQGHSARNWQL